MATTDLTSADYWDSDGIDIRFDPRRGIDASGLGRFLVEERGIESAVAMATSGSSGGFKFVVLPKAALLASARAVVEHCESSRDDVWLASLSTVHVGGLGIHARAYVGGSRVAEMSSGRWRRDGSLLTDAVRRANATLTSVTPTHLHDLVDHGVEAPPSLRGVFLGGGRIEPELVIAARRLGWPIWSTYGMSEASSQIATSREESVDWLPILSHWEVRLEQEGRLAIRGEALFSGYAEKEDGRWHFRPGADRDGWFVTGDRCEVDGERLRFLGRADDLVKISGELVSVSDIAARVASEAGRAGIDAAVVALPDSRREHELVLLVAGAGVAEGEALLERCNTRLRGIERLSRVVPVDRLPRTEIGKLDVAALRRKAGDL
ncbi:MAG: AMP-binding protein [Verrucomicrobiales bacterium]